MPPIAVLKALLNINPKDAERVPDHSPATRKGEPPEEPYHGDG
jgi:hypothetical protein